MDVVSYKSYRNSRMKYANSDRCLDYIDHYFMLTIFFQWDKEIFD